MAFPRSSIGTYGPSIASRRGRTSQANRTLANKGTKRGRKSAFFKRSFCLQPPSRQAGGCFCHLPQTPANRRPSPSRAANRGAVPVSVACTACRHPQVATIDQRLQDGDTAPSVAADFGLSYDALTRHNRNHRARLLNIQQSVPVSNGHDASGINVDTATLRDLLDELVDALRLRALAGDPSSPASTGWKCQRSRPARTLRPRRWTSSQPRNGSRCGRPSCRRWGRIPRHVRPWPTRWPTYELVRRRKACSPTWW